jgi:hypothetical protein
MTGFPTEKDMEELQRSNFFNFTDDFDVMVSDLFFEAYFFTIKRQL